MPGGGAGGDREAGEPPQEAARAPRPAARRKGEQEGRDADGQGRGQAEVAREQRVAIAVVPTVRIRNAAKADLRHVELRDALEVAQDLAALGDHARDRGEVAAYQHEVGHALGHLGAAALGDREPGRLQGGDVVDAVAEHRDVAPALAERLPRPRACPRARCVRPPATRPRPRAPRVVAGRRCRRPGPRSAGCRRPLRSPRPLPARRRTEP